MCPKAEPSGNDRCGMLSMVGMMKAEQEEGDECKCLTSIACLSVPIPPVEQQVGQNGLNVTVESAVQRGAMHRVNLSE